MSRVKVAKTIVFSSQADDYHNAIKFKNVLRWLKSGAEVQVQINSTSQNSKAIEIYKKIEEETKGGAILASKTINPQLIKFVLRPTTNAANFVIKNKSNGTESEDTELNEDLFSEEYERKLEQSISEERSKNMKKKP